MTNLLKEPQPSVETLGPMPRHEFMTAELGKALIRLAASNRKPGIIGPEQVEELFEDKECVVSYSPDNSWSAHALVRKTPDQGQDELRELVFSQVPDSPVVLVEREPSIDSRLTPENRLNVGLLLPHYDVAIRQDTDKLAAKGGIHLHTSLQDPGEQVGGNVHITVPDTVDMNSLRAELAQLEIATECDEQRRVVSFSAVDVDYPVIIADADGPARYSLPTAIENPRVMLARVEAIIHKLHQDQS